MLGGFTRFLLILLVVAVGSLLVTAIVYFGLLDAIGDIVDRANNSS